MSVGDFICSYDPATKDAEVVVHRVMSVEQFSKHYGISRYHEEKANEMTERLKAIPMAGQNLILLLL